MGWHMACVVWFVGASLDSGLDRMALKAFEKAFGWGGNLFTMIALRCGLRAN